MRRGSVKAKGTIRGGMRALWSVHDGRRAYDGRRKGPSNGVNDGTTNLDEISQLLEL